MGVRLPLLRAAVRAARPGLGLTRVPSLARLNDRLTNELLPWLYRRAVTAETVETDALGFRLRLDGRDSGVTPSLLVDGRYEPGEAELFSRIVQPGDVVVDVGANVGVYTLLAARAVGPSGRVYALEPDPRSFELLQANIGLNGFENVVSLRVAVGAREGKATLARDRHNAGLHSLARANVVHPAETTEVEVVTLDGLARGQGIERVNVVKLDVQGSEADVVAGGTQLFRAKGLVVFMEYWPAGLRNCGADPSKLLRSLAEAFSLDVIDPPVGDAAPAEVERIVAQRDGHAIDLVLRRRST